MKYFRSVLFMSAIFFALFCVFTPVQAKTYPTITVSIDKNPVTRHMYFAPTFISCGQQGTERIKFVNTTNSRASIQTDYGSVVSVPPHAVKYGYFTVVDNDMLVWTLL